MRRTTIFIVFVLATALMTGCSLTPSRIYSTPGTSTTPSKPTTDPKTRPYKVLGKWYYPLQTARGYDKIGIASWYGEDFHNKKTANGEIYNMHALTAAHKRLPLGTVVRVTNLSTNKSVEVRINDRGPFVGKRLIDLSVAAAKRIGSYDTGLAKVRITAIGSRPLPNRTPVAQTFFRVRVGSYSVRANAYRVKSALVAEGYPNAKVHRIIRNNKPMWAVEAGAYRNREDAKARADVLKHQFPGTFITTKTN